jgi:hypothetical protein
MSLEPDELSPDMKLYNMIDKVVIVKGTIPSDPTIWEFYILGKVLKVDAENLENMKPFRQQYLKAFDRPAPKIKAPRWPDILDTLATDEDNVEHRQAPEESSNVFIARQLFEIVCEKEISDDPDDAISGLTLFKYTVEDDKKTYCCLPSHTFKNTVDESGFKIPLNELSTTMTELKLKKAGTPAVRYGKGRR